MNSVILTNSDRILENKEKILIVIIFLITLACCFLQRKKIFYLKNTHRHNIKIPVTL